MNKELPKGITEYKPGHYSARFMYHGISKTIYGTDIKQLKNDLEKLKTRMINQVPENSKLSFCDACTMYIDKKKYEGAKEGTIRSYQNAIDNHLLPAFKNYRLADISRVQLRGFLNGINATGTVSSVYSVLNGIFKFAFYEGYIINNTMKNVSMPKANKVEKETPEREKAMAFSSSQYDLVYELAGKLDTCNLIRFTALTGLRLGEVRAVKYSDIDTKNSVLRVSRSIDTKGTISTPKTEAGKRIVPLSAEAIKLTRSKFISSQGYVFCDPEGEPYTASYISSEIRKLNSLCLESDPKFPKFSLHTFRHTFATKCANNGMIPKVLMGILGHKDINMTMNYYAHQEMESAISELKKVEGAF